MADAQAQPRQDLSGQFHSGGHQFNASQIHARNVHFHNATPNAGPSPSIVLPYRRNRDFIEQDALTEITDCLIEPGDRAAIVGIGGIGKSQVAIEYAYRTHANHPGTWVFWVHASNAARFRESYQSIANRAQIHNNANFDVLHSVFEWLSTESSGQWVLILDNADDPKVVFEPLDGDDHGSGAGFRSIADYLPVSRGLILVTTRSRDVATELIHYETNIFQLDPMIPAKARSLLHKKLRRFEKDDEAAMDDLAQKLEFMPLALAQAAAFINQRAPRMTISRYVSELDKGDEDRTRLLRMNVGDPWRDRQASNCIILTWHITFQYIQQTHGGAARLLSLMSFFDREAIPAILLDGNYSTNHDKDDFEEDIATLRAFDLIAIGTDVNVFKMHRLVQLSISCWLEDNSQAQEWSERGVTILSSEITWPDTFLPMFRGIPFEKLFAHIERALSYKLLGTDFALKQAEVLYAGAVYAADHSQNLVARLMYERVVQIRTDLLGEFHESTITGMIGLFDVMDELGQSHEMYRLGSQLLIKARLVFGPKNPITTRCAFTLARACRRLKLYEEAQMLLQEVVEVCYDLYGATAQDTLINKVHLALAYADNHKLQEAKDLVQSIYDDRANLSSLHPRVIMQCVSVLAYVYLKMELFDDSEALIIALLPEIKNNLGERHPWTLTTMEDLATVYTCQQRLDEAIEMMRHCVNVRLEIMGKDHPDTRSAQEKLDEYTVLKDNTDTV